MGGFLSDSKFSNRDVGDLVKNALVFGLLVLFTSQVGIGLVKTVSGFTLGSLARNMLPVFFKITLFLGCKKCYNYSTNRIGKGELKWEAKQYIRQNI